MANSKMGVYKINGSDKEFSFNFWTDLSAKDKMRFVNGVTDTLIGDNFYSFLRDLIFDFEIIDVFTDVDTSDIGESSDTISNIEELLATTNIVDIVKANVKEGLIDELSQAVDDNIEYRTGVHRNSISKSVVGLIKTIENKLNEIDVEGMAQLTEMLSGMNGEITADKVIEAYANSPIFLKTLEDRQKEHDKRFEKIANTISINKK